MATADGAAQVLDALPTSTSSSTTSGSSATPVLEIDDATWQRFWEVNVMSAIRLTRGYLPGMRDRGWGRVQFMAATRRS